jgi:recombination protein RecT
VQVVIGYRGLIDLARRSGQIVSIAAHEVYEQDKFELEYGLDEKLIHVPSFEEIKGEVIGFYAVAKLVGGGYAFEFMSARQVDLIRDNTQSKGRYGPWKDHYVEMGRKTVIRRLSKYLPLSVEFQMANSLDEQSANEKDQHLDTFDGEFSILADTYETEQPPAVEHQPGETLDFGTAQTAVEQEPVETRSSKPAQHKQSKPIPPSDDFGPME